jgi:hypothetical protein
MALKRASGGIVLGTGKEQIHPARARVSGVTIP